MFLKKLAFVLHLYAAILFLNGADVFLIIVSHKTANLSASFFISGSILFSISNGINSYLATGPARYIQLLFLFSNFMFIAGSIMFLPALNNAVVGNWIFEFASWLVIFLEAYKLYKLYKTPTPTWILEVIYRGLTAAGAGLFVVGNCLLINNGEVYLLDAMKIFTTGCVGFVVGGTAQLYMEFEVKEVEVKPHKVVKDGAVTAELALPVSESSSHKIKSETSEVKLK
jgi:hypothetical protein